MFIGAAAVQVRSRMDGCRRRVGCVFAVAVPSGHVEIGDGSAVRYNQALVAPFSTQDVVDKVVVGAAGNPAEAVIGNHHLLDAGFHHQVAEGRKIGFPEVPLADFGIEGMAVPFRPRVHGKVLGAGVGFQHGGVGRSLEAPDHRHAQLSGKIRVFPVGFHAPSPAGVAENVDVRRPERKALILAHMPCLHGLAVLDAGFVAHCGEDAVHQRFVKRGGHADGHGKYGGLSVSGNPVKGLVPPVVRTDSKAFYCLGFVQHERCFFFNGHFGNELFSPFLRGRCPAGHYRQDNYKNA